MYSSAARHAIRRVVVTQHRAGFRSSAALRMADDAGASANSSVILNLSSPNGCSYDNEPVHLVNVPGMTGEYGIGADMASTMSELKPGSVEVFKTDGGDAEKFFVPAGFALTHPNSRTDIACADLITMDEIDSAAAQAAYQEAKRKIDGLTEGSVEHAETQIELDVYEAACAAVGVSV